MWKKAVQINGKDKKYQNFHVVVHLLQLLEPNPRVIKRKKIQFINLPCELQCIDQMMPYQSRKSNGHCIPMGSRFIVVLLSLLVVT
jgi:hypothetical protein